jgi:protein disulfide-isomerase
MKTISSIVFVVILLQIFSWNPLQTAERQEDSIHWMTNFEQAAEHSRSTNRPMILFFTGSDWCGWCNKLEKEILDGRDFTGITADKLVFIKLDYPMKSPQDPFLKKQNEQLKSKFSVRSYPTIVLLDPDQQPIGVTGYRSGGGKQFANHILKMVNEYAAYKQQMKRLGTHKFSGKELKRLYQKAQELGLKIDQNLLVSLGMDSELSPFFISERYRQLASEGQITSNEAIALKRRLLAADPDNQYLTHYQIAVIDFETGCEDLETEKVSPDAAVKPLIAYIETFGSNDKENLWRLNYLIAQVYLEQNRLNDALKYAKNSHEAAPSSIQPDIAMAITNIQKQIDSCK